MVELPFEDIHSRFFEAIASAAGVPRSALHQEQTLLLPEIDRAGSDMAVSYHIGAATLIRTDPSLTGALAKLVSPIQAIDIAGMQAWAANNEWEFIDGADFHVLSTEQLTAPPSTATSSDAATQVTALKRIQLDRDVSADRSLIAALLEANEPQDVEAAEFEMDDLDPHIVGALDQNGILAAMASDRVWDEDPVFDDIGVLVDTKWQRQGLGASLVHTFCHQSFERARLPLYRCNWSRGPSKALASSLGFQLVAQVSALSPTL